MHERSSSMNGEDIGVSMVRVSSKNHLQLPPKKRKISCDLLNQDSQRDDVKQAPRYQGASGSGAMTSPAVVEFDISSKEPTNHMIDPVLSTDSSFESNEAHLDSTSVEKKKTNNKKPVPSEESNKDTKLAISSGVKQKKYVPDSPMSAEEMKSWRKEARRVRNRQSAAVSRQKIRDRIDELEVEVEDWKSKYEGVLDRIALLEKDAVKSI